MLKLAGSLLILTGMVGMAEAYYGKLKERYQELLFLEEVTAAFITEICALRTPLPEAIGKIAEKTGQPFTEFLLAVKTELEENREYRFHVIWEEQMKKKRILFALEETEWELLLELGKAVEQEHLGMYRERLEVLKEKIHRETLLSKEALREKRKFCLSLGAMGGLFVIIILI